MSAVSRRDFLAATTAAGGLALAERQASAKPPAAAKAKHCIMLLMIGGPSQLETWDPKPNAPSHVRGPFRPIATSVPGVQIGEHMPRLAKLAHRYAIIRSVHHDGPPVHEAGLQLLQTGKFAANGTASPHLGRLIGSHGSFAILPSRLGNLGLNVSCGQEAGIVPSAPQGGGLGRDRYGKSRFGDTCWRARNLVEQGTSCVVVNMFDTVYDRVTWDCHAMGPTFPGTLDDYRHTLCPDFDRACSALLDDLHQRGLLDETLVLAMGEIGRTPHLNANGGRDHWTRCWSIMLAGGGVRGGLVVGSSDRLGGEPASRPVTCPEVVASVYHAMGIAAPFPDARPIRELFA